MSAAHELGGPDNVVHPKDKEQNGIDSTDPIKHAGAVNNECANSEKPPNTQGKVPGDVHRDGEDSEKTPKQPSTSRLPNLEKMQDVANQVLLRYIQGQESEEYEDDDMIACRYCGFTLTKAEKLERITLKKHTRALFCGICRWSSSETVKLQKHLSTKHPGERTTFYCQNCEFRSNSILEGQLTAMYSSDMPYQCGECEYRARTTTALNYHVKAKHSNERPYKCPHCNYAGVQSSSLKSHMLTRHNAGEKNIVCTECDFRANIPSVMKKHMERKHSDIKVRPGSKRLKRQDSLDEVQRPIPLGEVPSLLHLQSPPTIAPLVAEPPRVQAAPEVTDYLQMPSFGLFEAIYESQGLAVGKAPQIQPGRKQNSDVIIIED